MKVGDLVKAVRSIVWHDDVAGVDTKHRVDVGTVGKVVHARGARDAGPTIDFGEHGITTALPGEVELVAC